MYKRIWLSSLALALLGIMPSLIILLIFMVIWCFDWQFQIGLWWTNYSNFLSIFPLQISSLWLEFILLIPGRHLWLEVSNFLLIYVVTIFLQIFSKQVEMFWKQACAKIKCFVLQQNYPNYRLHNKLNFIKTFSKHYSKLQPGLNICHWTHPFISPVILNQKLKLYKVRGGCYQQ